MYIVLAYIKFLLRSTNQHGVHSPFVYGLVTKCFYDKKKYPAYQLLKRYRKSLLNNERIIKVKDFGAGSRVFKSEKRKVSEIAKKAGISPMRARLLNRLVRYLGVGNALEFGTSLGLGTSAIAAGSKVKVTTIEGCPQTAAVAAEKFEEFHLDNIELKVGEFGKFLEESEEWEEDRGQRTEDNSKFQIPNSKYVSERESSHPRNSILDSQYSLLFIDGNHKKEATLEYFQKLLPHVHNDSIMIFDDIRWSKQMEDAWEEIKAHPQVKVTIDTFQWGLVFFRREQVKEHFVIRV